ncbi:MAG: OmpH family outer membrane protein [Candidatus Pacebacteria bacterium]|nr:OmpH family outer membrane protein [Candidatus Paceibacterota bacterium]MDD5013335.1 OmpH family outer membrane protein [Candidatus Paceibacterota bacterium]MDD5752623.1 OmpH family outer membrane protein [Candidatus Paceibacterota bacterium]
MIDTPLSIYVLMPSSIFILLVSLILFILKKERPYFIFFIIGVFQFFWMLVTYIMWKFYGLGIEINPVNEKVFSLCIFLMPVFLYHFSVEFCKITSQRIHLFVAYLVAFVFVFIADANKIVNGLFFYEWGGGSSTVYQFFVLFMLVLLGTTLYNFSRNILNKKQGEEKKDLSVILLLAFGVFGLVFIEFLPLQGVNIYPLFYLSIPVYALIMAYILIERNPLALVITTDILVTVAIAFPAALVVFQEVEMGITERSIIFVLISVASFMLLRYTLKMKNINKEFEKKLNKRTAELEENTNELINIKCQLEKANKILEAKIKERTKELQEANQNLEEQVKERTVELNRKAEELEEKMLELKKFSEFLINRENKMVELKNKIKKLEKK